MSGGFSEEDNKTEENKEEEIICFECNTNKSPFKFLNPCPIMEAKKRLKNYGKTKT